MFEEENAQKRPIVENPDNCVVLCSGRDSIFLAGAISHPSKMQTREIIKNLRKVYSIKQKGKESL